MLKFLAVFAKNMYNKIIDQNIDLGTGQWVTMVATRPFTRNFPNNGGMNFHKYETLKGSLG